MISQNYYNWLFMPPVFTLTLNVKQLFGVQFLARPGKAFS